MGRQLRNPRKFCSRQMVHTMGRHCATRSKKKRSGSEQKSDLATTRCGSNGRSQITGAHSSQSLKPRSHSPSQFLTKSLFALLQIALIRKHVPDPAPQFTTKSLLALYKITLCTFADRSDLHTRACSGTEKVIGERAEK